MNHETIIQKTKIQLGHVVTVQYSGAYAEDYGIDFETCFMHDSEEGLDGLCSESLVFYAALGTAETRSAGAAAHHARLVGADASPVQVV